MKPGELELRPVEVRSASAGRTLTGSIRYGETARIGGRFAERFERRSLVPAGDVLALWAHDPSHGVLGRTPRTLRLRNADDALHFEIDLPQTRLADDVREQIARGDVRGASVGFQAKRETWSPDARSRVIHEAELREISIVPLPAYAGAGNLTLRHREPPRPRLRLVLARRYLATLELRR